MSDFLRALEVDPALIAIPVFPLHCFRHPAICVNKASGIRHPQDLAGKLIGELALYGHDAGVMPKGILSDEYGVEPEQSRWIVGGIEFPLKPIDFVPQPHPAGVDVRWAAGSSRPRPEARGGRDRCADLAASWPMTTPTSSRPSARAPATPRRLPSSS